MTIKPTVKTKGPGARDGERSFGRHPQQLVHDLRGLKGQGAGMVNVLLAATTATRSRPRAIKGQEPGLVDVLLQPPEQTRSRRGRAEVVNELLWVAAKRTFTSPGPWPLITSHTDMSHTHNRV